MTTTPLIILVTGVLGSGKTAAAGKLREFGYDAIILDGHKNLCNWTEHNGHAVARPDEPGLGWLDRHSRTWNRGVLTDLIARKRASGADLVWLTGVATNTVGHDLRHLGGRHPAPDLGRPRAAHHRRIRHVAPPHRRPHEP